MDIKLININDCIPFTDNPFKIKDNIDMELLIQSIVDNGVLIPIVVNKVNDKYEVISGERRIYACKKAGIETIPALIKNMNRDEAVIFLVDSNLHREGLLPSEKAFAYKMRLEAMKHQGRTSPQVGQKLTSVQEIANSSSDSKTQIQRYIRLTYLEKPLLDMVDNGRIALTPAVELSYLTKDEQLFLIETIDTLDCTPSLSQAIRMKKLSKDGLLNDERILDITNENKGNQIEYLKLPTERIKGVFKPNTTYKQMEDVILKALKYYAQHIKKLRSNRDVR